MNDKKTMAKPATLRKILKTQKVVTYDTGIWDGVITRGTVSVALSSLDELLDGITQKAQGILHEHGVRPIYPYVSVRPEDPPIVHDAQMILGYLYKLQQLQKEASIPDLALDHALRIGFWFAVSTTRGEKELFALKGRKSIQGGKKGIRKIKKSAKERKTRVITEAQRLRQEAPTLRCRSAAIKIAQRVGGNPETIRKDIAHLWGKNRKKVALKQSG